MPDAMLTPFRNIVAGSPAVARSGKSLDSFDPFTGRPWATVPRCDEGDIDRAVSAAKAAFRAEAWSGLTPTARGRLLVRFAELLEAHADALAAIESRDNGKLLSEMGAQLRYIPEWFRYFGGLCDKIEGSVLPI